MIEKFPMQWRLPRRLALSPKQFGFALSIAMALCTAIGIAFTIFGAHFVLYFAGLDVAALLIAAWYFTRHANDNEVVTLTADKVILEITVLGKTERHEWLRAWLEIKPVAMGLFAKAPYEIGASGQYQSIGRFAALATTHRCVSQIRRALQGKA